MADFSERIKRIGGQALVVKGDIETIEIVARRHGCHQDLFTAITEAKLNMVSLIDMAAIPTPSADGELFLEVIS